jgi:hypothetical protein
MRLKCYFALILALGFSLCATAADDVAWDTYSDTWVSVDGLGRTVGSSLDGLPKPKANHTVGMFYYIWNGTHGTNGHPVNDVTEVLKNNPTNPDWGDYVSDPYFWGKPLLGYYANTDLYVINKHIQMMMDAGVDFLFFDCTNALTYDDAVRRVMSVIDAREAMGLKSPKLAYMFHSDAGNTLYHVFLNFYNNPIYNKYWYNWKGKPLALTSADEVASLPAKVQKFFTFRYSWAWLNGANKDQWSWLEYYPQQPGWSLDSAGAREVEQVSVSTAQHACTKVGKSYHNGAEPTFNVSGICSETPYGLYYSEQWKRAREVDPPVVMVTQFNECIAGRYPITSSSEYSLVRPGGTAKIGECYFIDEYNAEFNRDIEPHTDPLMRDNYLMLTFDQIRRYKGVREVPIPSADRTIKMDSTMDQWDAVTPEFRDDKGDIWHRDDQGYNLVNHMTNTTGRNDIVAAKVTKNRKNIFFYVRTRSKFTDPLTSSQWMMLYINADRDYSTGWEGYDYMVTNDSVRGTSTLLKNAGHYTWTKVMDLPRLMTDSEMCISVPRSAIGMSVPKDIDFKWADNTPPSPDILDFYLDGDVAPNGRFNYCYRGSVAGTGVETVAVTGSSLKAARHGDAIGVSYYATTSCGATVQIYNLLGSLIASQQVNLNAGDNTFTLDIAQHGLIVRVITDEGKSVSTKIF